MQSKHSLPRPRGAGGARRWQRFAGSVAGSALLAQAALAAQEPRPPDPTLAAPITAVTVYSGQARVVRSAHVTLTGGGAQRFSLPVLGGSVDPGSVRIDVRASQPGSQLDVERVEIAWVDSSELPVTEAQQLLTSLEQLDDQQNRLSSERAIYQGQLDLLTRLTPSAPPIPVGPGPKPAPLNPGGWSAVFGFVRAQQEKVQTRLGEVAEKSRALSRKRQQLVEQVRLLGGMQTRAGYRVIPTLRGQGSGELVLSYLTPNARWQPTYDIQLVPGRGQVELAFSGQVSQETGEDWGDVALTLSTAVPGTATELPRLSSWKIGARERFIPTPPPMSESPLPPPPPPLSRHAETSLADSLRQRLAALAWLTPAPAGAEETLREPADKAANLDERAQKLKQKEGRMKRQEELRSELENRPVEVAAADMPAPAPPPPPRDFRPYRQLERHSLKTMSGMVQSADTLATGELLQSVGGLHSAPATIVGVGIAPPPGYRAPQLDRSSAAAAAGGYDLSYPSLYKESIASGKGSRRVALFSRSFPVSVQRKIFPALAPEAYLVAEINNPSQQPLPGGQAHLFVGADPAGVATLNLVAPGEAFTLPLGLDRAVKPVRNVRMSTVERGVFSKDELTEYLVTTELVNPYRQPIEVRLLDQIPLQGDKNVELKLVRTEPVATPDPTTGGLQWRLTVPAGAKIETRFVYTLRRPKGARLYQ